MVLAGCGLAPHYMQEKNCSRMGRTGLKPHFISSAKTARAITSTATARLDGETLNEFYFASPPGPPNRSIGETA